MTEDSYSFTTARTRLEEIVAQVRKKDTSLEKSLDLLEEGVRLANACTEQIDHAEWALAPPAEEAGDAVGTVSQDVSAGVVDTDSDVATKSVVVDETVVVDEIDIVDEDGTVIAEVVEISEEKSVTELIDADEAWAEDFAEDALEPADPSADEG